MVPLHSGPIVLVAVHDIQVIVGVTTLLGIAVVGEVTIMVLVSVRVVMDGVIDDGDAGDVVEYGLQFSGTKRKKNNGTLFIEISKKSRIGLLNPECHRIVESAKLYNIICISLYNVFIYLRASR